MSSHSPAKPDAPEHHGAPLTLDGYAMLHQMFHFGWTEWSTTPEDDRKRIVQEAVACFEELEGRKQGQTALYSLLGHKGDLMLLHFRPDLEQLNQAERQIQRLALADYMVPSDSYLSVVELGLYSAMARIDKELHERGLEPGSDEWKQAHAKALEDERESQEARLQPRIPPRKHLCFYPMNRRRGEQHNWYTLPTSERARMMREHGMTGRRYAGRVTQVISGSIGCDDWEWGVDLFSDDALLFKQLIYEMRFDEASALYAEFGPFFVGLRVKAAELGAWLEG